MGWIRKKLEYNRFIIQSWTTVNKLYLNIMKKLIIFGVGDIAELAMYYFNNDSEYTVEAFCIDKAFREVDKFCGLDLVDFEDLELNFDLTLYSILRPISSEFFLVHVLLDQIQVSVLFGPMIL